MKQTVLLCVIVLMAFVYTCVFCSWKSGEGDPCNPVKPPVTITDMLGNDVTNDSVLKNGVYLRSRDGKTQKITIIINK